MDQLNTASIANQELCLPVAKPRSLAFLGVLVTAAVLLPVVSHLAGLQVRAMLPMHWPVLLAGLVYGWRGGAIVGILSPVISYALSGMPFPPMIPIMSAELAAYGMIGGVLRQNFRLPGILALGIALIVGRLVYITGSLLLLPQPTSTFSESLVRLAPGWMAAVTQLLLIPFLAGWWVKASRDV